MPTLPGRWIRAGMMPIFTFADGRMTPGQFGPTRRTFGRSARNAFTRIMSLTGIPSVIAMTRATPASAASMIASAAAGGGTKMSEALAPVFSTASWTVLKTGIPSTSCRPCRGSRPATTCVP